MFNKKIITMLALMSRADKIVFLMKSNLFDINKLTDMDEGILNMRVAEEIRAIGIFKDDLKNGKI